MQRVYIVVCDGIKTASCAVRSQEIPSCSGYIFQRSGNLKFDRASSSLKRLICGRNLSLAPICWSASVKDGRSERSCGHVSA